MSVFEQYRNKREEITPVNIDINDLIKSPEAKAFNILRGSSQASVHHLVSY